MLRPLILGSALLFAGAGAALAYPSDEVSVRSEVVHFGDLDINYAPDADALLNRIHTAARRVCRSDYPTTTGPSTRECAQDAQDRAVAQVDNTMLTARYEGVTPQIIIQDDDVDPYYKK